MIFVLYLGSFLLGAIPTGVMLSRTVLGRDIREFGSHNPGAVNVWRTFGIGWGLLVVAIDIGKGVVAARYLPLLAGVEVIHPVACGFLAVLGHIWSPFTGMKGGKGVGTACGAMAGIYPLAGGICILLWLAIASVTKYSSVASMVSGAIYPFVLHHFYHPSTVDFAFAIMLPLLLLWTHRENIRRLLDGTELKMERRNNV